MNFEAMKQNCHEVSNTRDDSPNNNAVFKIQEYTRYYSQRENPLGLRAIESRYDLSQGDGRLMAMLLRGKTAKNSPPIPIHRK